MDALDTFDQLATLITERHESLTLRSSRCGKGSSCGRELFGEVQSELDILRRIRLWRVFTWEIPPNFPFNRPLSSASQLDSKRKMTASEQPDHCTDDVLASNRTMRFEAAKCLKIVAVARPLTYCFGRFNRRNLRFARCSRRNVVPIFGPPSSIAGVPVSTGQKKPS